MSDTVSPPPLSTHPPPLLSPEAFQRALMDYVHDGAIGAVLDSLWEAAERSGRSDDMRFALSRSARGPATNAQPFLPNLSPPGDKP